jgi:hypothetical protein
MSSAAALGLRDWLTEQEYQQSEKAAIQRAPKARVRCVTVGKNLSIPASATEPCVSLSISHGSSVHEPLS